MTRKTVVQDLKHCLIVIMKTYYMLTFEIPASSCYGNGKQTIMQLQH